jgi:ribosome biogenesis SPOUT family RNA methylase Rps3
VPLSTIPFIDNPEFRFNENESVEMPFRYVTDKEGEPILPKGMRKLLKDDMDKGFEDEE